MTANKSFRSGAIWPDSHGVHINAHGGGLLLHNGIYYWFGEDRAGGTAGNTADGVHAYSSTDLDKWKEEGIIFRPVDDQPRIAFHSA